MIGPRVSWLPDGRRLHFNHGPIDLIVQAFGDEGEIHAAYRRAKDRFDAVLVELVEELPALRATAGMERIAFRHSTARRMAVAVGPFARDCFVTPMAAVAGAVADEMLAALVAGRRLARAYVNNGGDIAIHLADGRRLKAAIAGTGKGFADRLNVHAADPVRGIATSGRHGRSHSLGIADAVTVLAASAATADAAATLIANAVDLPGHAAIRRAPARTLDPDSDLGDRLVTVDVGPLDDRDIRAALAKGEALAQDFIERGLIEAAMLCLAGQERICQRTNSRLVIAGQSEELLHA